jgi:hypothetical protein
MTDVGALAIRDTSLPLPGLQRAAESRTTPAEKEELGDTAAWLLDHDSLGYPDRGLGIRVRRTVRLLSTDVSTSLPGPPLFQHRKQYVSHQFVEGCVTRVIAFIS